jgi:hypothetical protein
VIVFQLWVKMESGWEHACSVISEDPHDALCEAVLLLRPEHKGREVQLRFDARSPQVHSVC